MAVDKYKVPASMLAPTLDPEQLVFKDTSELTPLSETIGQERAVGALEFGLQMMSPGFNIYVSGPGGTGKGTLVRQMVKRLAQAAAVASRRFSVLAVGTLDEAIEILTGLPAGERNVDAVYQPGTLYAQAARRLHDMALVVAEWGDGERQSHRRMITEG